MTNNGSIIIDLAFAPDWARRPPTKTAQPVSAKTSRDNAGPASEQMPRARRRPFGPGHPPNAGGAQARTRRDSSPPSRQPAAAPPVRPPVQISFIPERAGLKHIAKWLASTRRAHPLAEVALMFLSKPAYFAVKVESERGENATTPRPMFQCSICKLVFMEKDEALGHLLSSHMDMFYKAEEVRVDPPSGNFTCVAQCRLSGELLGPPNYHGYSERVSEMRRSRFAGMSMDEYRKHIVNRSEKELLEKWREEVCRQTRYSTIRAAEPQTFSRRADLETHFRNHHANDAIREATRFIIHGTVAVSPNGGAISEAVGRFWRREQRAPARMGGILISAFRRQGLHVFKTREKIVHATAIRPNHVAPSQTESRMRGILETLAGKPIGGRVELVKSFCPGVSADSPEAAEIISRLCWLIERGHVIEFADGRLEAPPAAS